MNDIMKAARKQYFKDFSWLFIVIGILVVIYGFRAVTAQKTGEVTRSNSQAPSQRVYDYAGSLSADEVEELEAYIAKMEQEAQIDIVILTTNQYMGVSDYDWTRAMVNTADDFYDNGAFGYNKPYGDGALFLYNWYVDDDGISHKGEWLSTSGRMIDVIGSYEEGEVLDAVDREIFYNPYLGYKAAVEKLAYYGKQDLQPFSIPWAVVVILPLVIAFFYATINMKQKKAEVTVVPTTYVKERTPQILESRDDFIRKDVSFVRIETSSSSGGSHGGGSYGRHTSSGGHSHGGGGRRH